MEKSVAFLLFLNLLLAAIVSTVVCTSAEELTPVVVRPKRYNPQKYGQIGWSAVHGGYGSGISAQQRCPQVILIFSIFIHF
jgi:hypothetical protein